MFRDTSEETVSEINKAGAEENRAKILTMQTDSQKLSLQLRRYSSAFSYPDLSNYVLQ